MPSFSHPTLPTLATCLVVGAAGPAAAGVVPEALINNGNTIEQIIADAADPHDARPNGVPYDWGDAPRLGMGTNPPASWNAATAWGQVYEAVGGNPVTNVRVQIRRISLSFLDRRTGDWSVIQDVNQIGGAFYREDFVDDISYAADFRDEAEGRSIRLPNGAGLNFHFWPDAWRSVFPLEHVQHAIASVEARLILDDLNGPDNLDDARLMMSTGADYWESQSAQWDQWTTNGDIGIGRFGFLTRDWHTFNMTTLTAASAEAIGLSNVAGDLDRDGRLDANDVDPFLLGLNDPTGFRDAFGYEAVLHGDMNGDGELNRADARLFAQATGVSLPGIGNPIPEPASAALLAVPAAMLLRRRAR